MSAAFDVQAYSSELDRYVGSGGHSADLPANHAVSLSASGIVKPRVLEFKVKRHDWKFTSSHNLGTNPDLWADPRAPLLFISSYGLGQHVDSATKCFFT